MKIFVHATKVRGGKILRAVCQADFENSDGNWILGYGSRCRSSIGEFLRNMRGGLSHENIIRPKQSLPEPPLANEEEADKETFHAFSFT